jgi:hypothetical protein
MFGSAHGRRPMALMFSLAMLATSVASVAAEPLTSTTPPGVQQVAPAAASERPDPCALFTADEIEAVIGPLSMDPRPVRSSTGQVVMCQLARERSFITVEVKPANEWSFLTDTNAYRQEDVDGLGEKATFLSSPYSEASALYVMKAPYILDIGVAGNTTTNLTYARNLAEVALARLP